MYLAVFINNFLVKVWSHQAKSFIKQNIGNIKSTAKIKVIKCKIEGGNRF